MNRLMTLITLMGVLVAAGCAPRANFSGNIRDDASEEAVAQPVEGTVVVEESSSSLIDSAAPSGGLLEERHIYFDYDQFAAREADLPIIGAHSDHLTNNPRARVILEGHADNRGSNEYNLALGQRRADAVRDIMLANGVLPTQMETLSFGEEDPFAVGENEEAWALNRRVRIRYSNE